MVHIAYLIKIPVCKLHSNTNQAITGISLEYKGSNVGISVGCYHATIDLRGRLYI